MSRESARAAGAGLKSSSLSICTASSRFSVRSHVRCGTDEGDEVDWAGRVDSSHGAFHAPEAPADRGGHRRRPVEVRPLTRRLRAERGISICRFRSANMSTQVATPIELAAPVALEAPVVTESAPVSVVETPAPVEKDLATAPVAAAPKRSPFAELRNRIFAPKVSPVVVEQQSFFSCAVLAPFSPSSAGGIYPGGSQGPSRARPFDGRGSSGVESSANLFSDAGTCAALVRGSCTACRPLTARAGSFCSLSRWSCSTRRLGFRASLATRTATRLRLTDPTTTHIPARSSCQVERLERLLMCFLLLGRSCCCRKGRRAHRGCSGD